PLSQRCRSESSSMPVIAAKRVNRHRFAGAPSPNAAHRESELGCQAARWFVRSIRDVRGDPLDIGATPEITYCGFHRLGRDSFVPPALGHPPARLDFVGRDA